MDLHFVMSNVTNFGVPFLLSHRAAGAGNSDPKLLARDAHMRLRLPRARGTQGTRDGKGMVRGRRLMKFQVNLEELGGKFPGKFESHGMSWYLA